MAATGINFERCKVLNSEKHNGRDAGYIAAVNASPNKKYDIFRDCTYRNETFIAPEFKGKTLPILLDELRKLYKEKVGQAPQEDDRVRQITDKKTGMKREVVTPGWSPIREGICPVKADTKPEDFEQFIKWLESKGPKVIRIDIHHDEGYVDPLEKVRKYNRHAHITVDWINHTTGKTFKLNKEDAREMQTQLALSLGMERGKSKEETGLDHVDHMSYREKAIADNIEHLEKVRKDVTDSLRECCLSLQEIGKDTVGQFDQLIIDGGGSVKPRMEEKEHRDELQKASTEDISKLSVEELQNKTRTLRSLIRHTGKSIERIGKKLQSLAAKIPDTKFHLFSSSSQKAQILAIEAEKESEIANIRAEAERAVKEAENAKNEAIRQADEKVRAAQEALRAAETEAKRRSTAALNREQEARETEKKYNDLNANLEQIIAEAREAAQREGINIQQQKWLKWAKDKHAPLKTKVKNLETKLADKDKELSETKVHLQNSMNDHLQQAIDTAKTLIRTFGARPFEENPNCDFTEFNSWQTAKKEIAQEQKQNTGVKMH